MEKRNLYLIIVIVLVVGLALSFYSNFTGQTTSTLGTDKGKCIDSDGGVNYEVRGTAKYENRVYTYTDYCFSRGKGPAKWLKEYFCLVGIESKEYQCENGCVNGACIK